MYRKFFKENKTFLLKKMDLDSLKTFIVIGFFPVTKQTYFLKKMFIVTFCVRIILAKSRTFGCCHFNNFPGICNAFLDFISFVHFRSHKVSCCFFFINKDNAFHLFIKKTKLRYLVFCFPNVIRIYSLR